MKFGLTMQEAFDVAYHKVIEQGRPAIIDGNCQYSAPNGDRCAAGHVFHAAFGDGMEDFTIEGVDAGSAFFRMIDSQGPDAKGMSDLLDDIQNIHDQSHYFRDNQENDEEFVSLYRHGMETVANTYNLTVPV
jgi:hypothetical protein